MTVSNNAEIFNSKQANTTLMNSVQEVQTQLVVAGMGVDPYGTGKTRTSRRYLDWETLSQMPPPIFGE